MRENLRTLARKALGAMRPHDSIDYWTNRAREHGARAVMNLGFDDAACEAATRQQRDTLFALLRPHLRGDEQVALDLGCGPGRFTAALADLIGGRAIGVEPVRALLDMAPPPPHERVEYRLMRPGELPVESASIDLAWICLVLGGITTCVILDQTLCELFRVLKPGALIFLAENTSPLRDHAHWKYRSVGAYRAMFPFAELAQVGEYDERGERISVLAGRKRTDTAALQRQRAA